MAVYVAALPDIVAGPVSERERSDEGLTVIDAEAVLLDEVGSGSTPESEALLTIVPVAVDVRVTVTVAVPVGARLPIVQVTGPLPLHVPTVDVAETKLPGTLNVSVRTTPVAAEGPLFVTVRVIAAFCP